MNILWLATKSPWPPTDGGRLVTWLTLQELHRRGHRITLLAPELDPKGDEASELESVCRPRLLSATLPGPLRTALRSASTGLPFTMARHYHPGVARELERQISRQQIDVVHAEQLQTTSYLPKGEVPLVARAQNVESDLWLEAARVARPPRRWPLELEGRRLAKYEARALSRPTRLLALTDRDARRLERLVGREVTVAPPPFPARLEPGSEDLAGDPPLVILGGRDWFPNREGTTWFLREIWPSTSASAPGAHLHLFGWPPAPSGRHDRVTHHPAAATSEQAFAPGSVLIVPLRVASGIRMKILEAWARGIPVVATAAGAAGLAVESGRELEIADDPDSFAEALRRLSTSDHRRRLVESGRAYLERHHDPTARAEELVEIYRSCST